MRISALAIATFACLSHPAFSQQKETAGPRLGESLAVTYRVGFVVAAKGGPCAGLVATVPVPADWPEQTVTIVDEDKSPWIRSFSYRTLEGGVKQLRATIPRLPAGQKAHVLVTLKIVRHELKPPANPSQFVLPDRPSRSIRKFLGSSPYIESTHSQIKSLARKLAADKKEATAWEKVEAIYDWVRENVQYQDGPLNGALRALRDGNGDCEELSSLFIALCRANKIPARTVWIPGHCYPEFYLEDQQGRGHWIPCQAAGARQFGGMGEHRPILQKGDNFRTPEQPRDRKRYVAEFLTGKGGAPSVKFIRQLVGDHDAK